MNMDDLKRQLDRDKRFMDDLREREEISKRLANAQTPTSQPDKKAMIRAAQIAVALAAPAPEDKQ